MTHKPESLYVLTEMNGRITRYTAERMDQALGLWEKEHPTDRIAFERVERLPLRSVANVRLGRAEY